VTLIVTQANSMVCVAFVYHICFVYLICDAKRHSALRQSSVWRGLRAGMLHALFCASKITRSTL